MQALHDENAAAPPPTAGKPAAAPTPMRRRALGDLTNVRGGATPAAKAASLTEAPPSVRPPRPVAPPAAPPRAAAAPQMAAALAPPDAPEALAGLPLAAQLVLAEQAAEAEVAARVAAVCAGAQRYGGASAAALPPAFAVLDDGLEDRPPSEPGSPVRVAEDDWAPADDAAPSPPSLDDALASLLASLPGGSPTGDSVVVGSDRPSPA